VICTARGMKQSRILARPLIAFGLLAAPSVAAAQEIRPFSVAQDLYILLPGGGDDGVGVERTVVPGDELLRTGIAYSAAARLSGPISLLASGVPIDVPATLPLPEVRALGTTRDRLPRGTRIFCGTQRLVANIASPPPPGPHPKGKRFQKHVMPCFVDADGDSRLESAFLVGTRWAQDIVILPIEPVAFQEVNDIPLPASWASISFEKSALKLNVTMFGQALPLNAVKLGQRGDRKRFPVERSIKKEVYPHEISFGAALITLIGYEPEGRKLRVRLDHGFDRAELDFEFIVKIEYIYY
jgi:hypothetical protein